MPVEVLALAIERDPASRQILAARLQQVPGLRLLDAIESWPASLDDRPCNLIVLGLDPDFERNLVRIQSLARLRPDLAILPVSASRDSDRILRTIRAGAREFVTFDATSDEFATAIERLMAPILRQTAELDHHPAQLLAIAGAMGGVGCTSFAVNLASALILDLKREAALVDLDLVMGAVDVCLDLAPVQTLADVTRNASRLDPMLLKRSLTRHDSGLHVLPVPRSLEDAASIEPASIRQLLELLSGLFPVVIADLSKSYGPIESIALEMATTILLVVQLDPVCLRNTARLLHAFEHAGGLIDKVRIVANRVGSNAKEISVKRAQQLLERPIEWQFANTVRLFESCRTRGVPLVVEGQGSRPHRAIVHMARSLFDEPKARPKEPPTRLGRIAASFF